MYTCVYTYTHTHMHTHTHTTDTPFDTWQQFSTSQFIHFVSFTSSVAEETEVEFNIHLQCLYFYAFP